MKGRDAGGNNTAKRLKTAKVHKKNQGRGPGQAIEKKIKREGKSLDRSAEGGGPASPKRSASQRGGEKKKGTKKNPSKRTAEGRVFANKRRERKNPGQAYLNGAYYRFEFTRRAKPESCREIRQESWGRKKKYALRGVRTTTERAP